MISSITIGDKNTLTDFGLLPQRRLTVATPEVKAEYVDVHGTDGPLDLTTAPTGDVQYGSREGAWDFAAANRYRDPFALQHELNNYLHGRRMRAILSSDPQYYYMGRYSVEVGKLNRGGLWVTIKYVLEPYKYELASSAEPWLWDPFSFETGIIRDYADLVVDGTLELDAVPSARPCVPVIESSVGGMIVEWHGMPYTLSTGSNYIPGIVIRDSQYLDNILTFTGHGTVSVSYRGGWL